MSWEISLINEWNNGLINEYGYDPNVDYSLEFISNYSPNYHLEIFYQ